MLVEKRVADIPDLFSMDNDTEVGPLGLEDGEKRTFVSQLTNDAKKAGVITGREKGAIQSCAAGANIP